MTQLGESKIYILYKTLLNCTLVYVSAIMSLELEFAQTHL